MHQPEQPGSSYSQFCIVTPVFNGATYIDDTIASVLTQAGDFELHYHIQDGGSTDATLERVARWKALLDSGALPVLCRSLTFTVSSEPDSGMYDAVNKGFAQALRGGPDVVMGWIAADDRIAPGAFSTIGNIRRQFPDVRFLGGRVSLLDVSGSVLGVDPPRTYSRPCMAAGLYDGRKLPFVMQEGSFWCADLWQAVGGRVDTGFRLAGDWDLWRRMAEHADYIVIDTVLGFHRRRPGQLSEHMDRYYQEVDGALRGTPAPLKEVPVGLHPESREWAAAEAALRDRTLEDRYRRIYAEFEQLNSDPAKHRASHFSAELIRYQIAEKRWERLKDFGLPPREAEIVDTTSVRQSVAVVTSDGFYPAEGPYPEWGLPFGIRWIKDPEAHGEVEVDRSDRYTIVIRCRTWLADQVVTIRANGVALARIPILPHGHDREIELRASVMLSAGVQKLTISVEQPAPEPRLLLIVDWRIYRERETQSAAVTPVQRRIAALPSRIGPPLIGREWPRISIVVPTRNQAQYLADTLDSVLGQGYPNLELIVVDGASSDETDDLLRIYGRHITHLISEPDAGQSEAINKGFAMASGEILAWLNSDDVLAEGALHAVAFAFVFSGADLVAGICELFDDGNRILQRHIPCLADGPIPLKQILDLENGWLRGQFFHQPEVFFTRTIWEQVGAHVDQSLYYSMDYDLWARMAAEGATISVIGRAIARYRMHPAQKTSSVEAYRPELTAHSTHLRALFGRGVAPDRKELRSRLRVVLFNDYGFKYGAGIAHRRLAEAFSAAGHEVIALAYADFDKGPVERSLDATDVAEAILDEQPDLVLIGNLHSIAADFDLLGALLPSGVPTIFYAHDKWITSGRCGYPGSCRRYLDLCNAECPTSRLYPALPADEIAPAFVHKREVLRSADRLVLFTNSRYMSNFISDTLARDAPLPSHVIPIGVDTRVFMIGSQRDARALLDLPTDRFIVMTAAANLEDRRKGLFLLLEALASLPHRDRMLLLVMGFGEPLENFPCETRFTGFLDREEIIAAHYQAADIFVAPSLEEAFGQTNIEAAACGLPSIALATGGVGDAILSNVTGLLIERAEPEALAAGIQMLRDNVALRRRMGLHAALYAANQYSLEASAARLVATLVAEPVLDLRLAPNIVFPADGGSPPALRYLIAPDRRPVRLPDRSPMIPLANISTESGIDEPGDLPDRFWLLLAPACRFALKVPEAGQYVVVLRGRCEVARQTLRVSFNSGTASVIEIESHSPQLIHEIRIETGLRAGLNRIDLRFDHWREETPGGRLRGLLLDFIDIRPTGAEAATALADGAVELESGFSSIEGPYPEYSLPTPFRWVTGHSNRLRIFSEAAGKRAIELRLRNANPGQKIRIYLGDELILERAINDVSLAPFALYAEAVFGHGFNPLRIETSAISEPDVHGRALSFAYEGLRFCALELARTAPTNAIRWDMSEGIGLEEPPYPVVGLMRHFRWIVSRQVRLIVDRISAERVRLTFAYRGTIAGQRAALSVNGASAVSIPFRESDIAVPAAVSRIISLKGGQNLLDLTFAEATSAEGDPRELCVIIEEMRIEPVEDEAVDATEELPAGAIYTTEPDDNSWQCRTGFGFVEPPIPELALTRPFRWAVDELSIIGVYSSKAGHKRVDMVVRSSLPDQKIRLMTGSGTLLDDVALAASDRPQRISFVMPVRAGWQDVLIRPAVISAPSLHDPRRLTFLLEGLGVSDEEVTQEIA